jgi:three-Cys-motif partner protein
MHDNFFIAKDDGLITPAVRSWTNSKYRIVYEYNELFSRGMKKLWDQRIYIDLYSGAGKAKLEKTNQILYGSPLLALKVPDPYDKYIFCDKEVEIINALKLRVENKFNHLNVKYIVGDCNEKIDEIFNFIPQPSRGNTILTFCFVDPYSLKIKFETIKKLSKRFVDFLVLLAFGMDGKRNIRHYIKDNNRRIDEFLGLEDWRARWNIAEQNGENLAKFLADEFTNQMVELGYRQEAINNFISFRSDEKNLPLYYLAFYTRHPKGYDFWKKVKNRNSDPTFFD